MSAESIDNIEVQHNEAESRFEILLDGQLAFAEYQRAGNYIIFTHTEVPDAFAGRGFGGKLAYTALEHAKAQGYRVQALCPFMNTYVKRHKEYHPITLGYSEPAT